MTEPKLYIQQLPPIDGNAVEYFFYIPYIILKLLYKPYIYLNFKMYFQKILSIGGSETVYYLYTVVYAAPYMNCLSIFNKQFLMY